MSALMVGTVKVEGRKDLVLEMFNNLENYYDKELINENGTDNCYNIEFKFASEMSSFFSYDYFAGYSEEYDCEIIATMGCAEDDAKMILNYKQGNIIKGLSDYGIDSDDF